ALDRGVMDRFVRNAQHHQANIMCRRAVQAFDRRHVEYVKVVQFPPEDVQNARARKYERLDDDQNRKVERSIKLFGRVGYVVHNLPRDTKEFSDSPTSAVLRS